MASLIVEKVFLNELLFKRILINYIKTRVFRHAHIRMCTYFICISHKTRIAQEPLLRRTELFDGLQTLRALNF